MKKNLLGANTEIKLPGTVSFMDGFRFGFGMFIAWLLGVTVVSGLVWGVLKAFRLI